MKKIIDKINRYQTIMIHGHIRPDGDCLGSQFGMKDLILNNFSDKKVYVVGENSEYVSFLGKIDTVSDELYDDALAIVVDCGSADRISDKRYAKAKEVIKIDHHLGEDYYGTMNYIKTDAASCCEIITKFIMDNNFKVSKEGALALYVGIVTDTGRFRFDSVSSDTFNAAAFLVKQGISLEYVDQKLSVETMQAMRLKGYVLENFKVTPNGFAYIEMRRGIINKFDVNDETASSMVSLIGGIEGYPVWALFMEYEQEIRIRLRSRGPVVNVFAEKYNGGGHAKASGARLDSWEDLPQFLNDINGLLDEYNRSLK